MKLHVPGSAVLTISIVMGAVPIGYKTVLADAVWFNVMNVVPAPPNRTVQANATSRSHSGEAAFEETFAAAEHSGVLSPGSPSKTQI